MSFFVDSHQSCSTRPMEKSEQDSTGSSNRGPAVGDENAFEGDKITSLCKDTLI